MCFTADYFFYHYRKRNVVLFKFALRKEFENIYKRRK